MMSGPFKNSPAKVGVFDMFNGWVPLMMIVFAVELMSTSIWSGQPWKIVPFCSVIIVKGTHVNVLMPNASPAR